MNKDDEHIDQKLIRESKEELYDNAPCGYLSTLMDGTIVKINQTLLTWLGLQPEEVIRKKKFQNLLSIGGRIFYETHHSPLIKMQGIVKELSYELVCKNGNKIPVLTNGELIKNEEEKRVGFKYTFFNITDRKKYESELLIAKKKAEQAAISKSEFLSTVSHEIRTPLNAIIGLTNILRDANTNPENKEYLDILKFSADNLLDLINDILDLSRIESGKVTLEVKDFILLKLLNSIATTFRFKADLKGIEIKVQADKELPEVLIGDQLKIGQLFTNLLGNALKFTEKGSIIIEATLVQKTEERAIIFFSVADSGIGIPQDKIDAIFEQFTQASSQIAIKYGGTGLGLAISQKILELHGSRMAVESEINKGSKFYFTLNLKIGNKEKVLVAEAENPGDFRKLAGAKILLCEDNNVNVLIVSKYLKSWDIEFDVASNGGIALNLIQENYYDLILMDLQMPLMDGYEATEKIRHLVGDRYKQIPILALTASTDQATRDKIIMYGMNDYISKPFEPKVFYNKLVKYVPLNFLSENVLNELAKTGKELYNNQKINFDKYKEMAAGETDFLFGLTEETIINFYQYKTEFRQVIQSKDIDQLQKLAHKTKMVIDILEIKSLEQLIQNFLNSLIPGSLNEAENRTWVSRFDSEFDSIIDELKLKQGSLS